jgi:hypothetical protein
MEGEMRKTIGTGKSVMRVGKMRSLGIHFERLNALLKPTIYLRTTKAQKVRI